MMVHYKAIVVYNKFLNESASYNSLKKFKNIIIYDNSDNPWRNSNKDLCRKMGYEYITHDKNTGLSIAYNEIIKKVQQMNEQFYISWFDDDTTIPDEYFKAMEYWIHQNKYDVLIPIVMDNVGILSPSYIWKNFYPIRVKQIQNLNTNVTAINSGLCVSWEVYEKISYNEKLFLDYIDHTFFNELRENKYTFKIVNTTLEQSFSETSNQTKEQAEKRFIIYAKDFSTAFSGWYTKLFLLVRAAKKSLKYRSINFVKIAWRNIL